MGSVAFCKLVEGRDIEEIFDKLVDDAIRIHGDDSYNGTISTCSLVNRAMKTYSKYNEENEETAYKWIEEVEQFGEKWEARYVDLGIIGYDVISVKKKTLRPNVEYKMQYCVYQIKGLEEKVLLTHKDTKKAADDEAIKYALLGKKVCVEKNYVKTKGSAITTEFEITTKRYKNKPKMKESENKKIVPIKKFYIYGWAAC